MTRLTQGHGTLSSVIENTYPGQAHWAGMGQGHCYECLHWGRTKAKSGPQYRRAEDGCLKPKRCAKYTELNHGLHRQEGVPALAWACKYHRYNQDHPELMRD